MEGAARNAVAPYLEGHDETVGAGVDVRHLAATPMGQEIRAHARVTAVEGRKISFEIEAFDELRQIGKGTHVRVRIDSVEFKNTIEKDAHPDPGPRGDVSPSGYETLMWEVDGALGRLTLNRPKKANALSLRMVEEIEDLSARLADDRSVRVVIITGAGSAFCAGDDISELPRMSTKEAELLSLRQGRMFNRFRQLPQVLVAAVNGPAMGAGLICAVACDLRVAGLAARFGMPEIRLGFPPGYGNAQLIQLVGGGHALRMTLTGDSIDAKQAEQIGLVEQTVPQMVLNHTVGQLADKLLDQAPEALRETKRILWADRRLDPDLSYVGDTAAYAGCFGSEDVREGIAAFLEKRSPSFTGR